MDLTIEDKKQIIMRQTNYNYEETSALLNLHNNDITSVIRLYLKGETEIKEVLPKPLSMNQQIYKEIRSLMNEIELDKNKA
jgi:hypothetical protein